MNVQEQKNDNSWQKEGCWAKIHAEGEYAQWIKENEWDAGVRPELKYMPLISVVVPVYNVIDEQLTACIESIKNQTYSNWELILVDDCSTWKNVRIVLQSYESVERIKVIYREKNGHISEATNTGLRAAEGVYIAFVDCDDVLAPNALYEIANALNHNTDYDFIYSDEDKLTEDGTIRHDPFFKPDWSPDTFMSMNYTNHLSVFRTELVNEIGGLRSEFNGSQDYDFTLRFMEKSDNKKVCHIPKVLYYWRERKESVASEIGAKKYTLDAARKAKEEALIRRKINGKVVPIDEVYQYRVVYENPENPLVSIIIPSKDNYVMLERCIDTLINLTEYPNYEIIVVDNGSDIATKQQVENLLNNKRSSYYYKKMEFNFSRMCNIGAEAAKGSYLLFLNDDMEIIKKDWLSILVGQASQSHVGAVGAKLFYPKSRIIQHAGVHIFDLGPVHSMLGKDDDCLYYFGRNRVDYNYIAVTGACLLVSTAKFWEINGFDEKLAVTYNDIDLCLKLYERGYYNVLRNDVTLYHHESASRGDDTKNTEKMKRLIRERERLFARYPKLCRMDPFYSPNLVQTSIDYKMKLGCKTEITEVGLSSYSQLQDADTFKAAIDSVRVVAGYLMISGWAMDEVNFPGGSMNKKVLLKGNNNKEYLLSTKKIERKDVVEIFGGDKENAENYGFEVCIPVDILGIELFDYVIEVVVEGENKQIGKKVERTLKTYLSADSLVPEMNLIYEGNITALNDIDVTYKIEEIYEAGTDYIIEGWCFVPNEDIDWRKQLLFTTKEGYGFSCNVERVERIDVAAHYINQPYILYCGFRCKCKIRDIRRLGDEVQVGFLFSSKYESKARKKLITDRKL